MWPILLCSIIAVGIAIDRYLVMRKAKMNSPKFLVKIRTMLKKKDVTGAISFCLEERTPAANIVRKGLKKYRFGHERVKEAIESAGREEVTKLEKGLPTLATVSGIAPLLGFLGTVTGMISTFMIVQDLKGSASPADLAGGIWEALLTTAFGLFVGIPALALYNYFQSAIAKLIGQMETIANDVVDTIESVTHGVREDLDDEDINI